MGNFYFTGVIFFNILSWYIIRKFGSSPYRFRLSLFVSCLSCFCAFGLIFNYKTLNPVYGVVGFLLLLIFKIRSASWKPAIERYIPKNAVCFTYEEIVDKFSRSVFMFNNGIVGNKFELHRLMKQQDYFARFNTLVDELPDKLKSIKFPNINSETGFVNSLMQMSVLCDSLTSDFLFEKDENTVLNQYYSIYEVLENMYFISLVTNLSSEEFAKFKPENSMQETLFLNAISQTNSNTH